MIRPPRSWTLPGPGTQVDGIIRARDLALALQQITESDGTKPMPFPGVFYEGGEEELRTLPTHVSDFDRW